MMEQTQKWNQSDSESILDRSEILTPEERKWLLISNNGKHVPLPNTTIIDLIENQCVVSEQHPAIICDNEVITYGELNGKANSLSLELHELGIKRGDIIPLLLDESLDLAMSAMALMKLGAVFIPLDVDWPASRIEKILADLDPAVALIDGRYQYPVTGNVRLKTINFSETRLSETFYRAPVSSEDAIFGFYTSGSTGAPKCALNKHLGIVNRFTYMNRNYQANGREVILQNSKHVFDAWIWQIFWPLTNGAKVIVPRSRKVFDLLGAIDLIEKHKVTMTDFVPSVFNVLIDYLTNVNPAAKEKLRTLRYILIGGEELNAEAIYKCRVELPHINLTNTYGPTETSIGVIFFEIDDKKYKAVPIGRPIDNVKVILLDERRNLVPKGSTGEIYLGGACVGLGYLNDPDKTNAAFIKNPFPEIMSDRLYKTGDLAYYLPNGDIHFVGRKDQQVKVRGVRIELGEIEVTLHQHPDVKHAKVLLDKRTPGQEELVAFIVGVHRRIDVESVRGYIKREIPSYMLPAHYVALESMPLDHNGKVDRKTLLQNYQKRAYQCEIAEMFTPESKEEAELLALWKEVLNVSSVTSSDNFFDFGGDSLLAVLLTTGMQSRLGRSVSLQQLYKRPTFGELRQLLRGDCETAGSGEKQELLEAIEDDLGLLDDLRIEQTHREPIMGIDNVLLTGATGFIGSHLLIKLLASSNSKVYCLVRAKDETDALMRIRARLNNYDFDTEQCGNRIFPVSGDLASPSFGLSDEYYRSYSNRIDTVVHCGAMVEYLRDYQGHRASNVLGTAEVIRFCANGKVKSLHYLSTLGVFPLGDYAAEMPIPEDLDLHEQPLPHDGYCQSKWVAEQLVTKAIQKGVPGKVYRPGEVMPNLEGGTPNKRSLSHMLISGILKLGIFPKTKARVDYVPVDFAVEAILHLLKRQESPAITFNLRHEQGIQMRDIMAAFRKEGFKLEEVEYQEFWRELESRADTEGAGSELYLLRSLLRMDIEGRWKEDALSKLFYMDYERVSNENTRLALLGSGIAISDDVDAVVRAYAAFCRRELVSTQDVCS